MGAKRAILKAIKRHAHSLLPRIIPSIGWMEPFNITGETADHRHLWFPLSSFSHLTSAPDRGEYKNVGAEERPAILHLRNGNEHVMLDSFGVWRDRINKMYGEAMKIAIEVPTTRPRASLYR